jgi:leucyl/phenylalanyl-tRNA--protein transferase
LESALDEPNGLLAVGGCLSPQRLINAYQHGAFPWFNPGEPILWWSPDPRLVLFPERLNVSRSLQKTLRQQRYSMTFDQAFEAVIEACSAPRSSQSGTWISQDMKLAYLELHRLGIAHSVEAWLNGDLVGGLYGIAIGRVFFGESMFHRATDASKVAFATLVEKLIAWDCQLIDCQVSSPHLLSLGAEEIPRREFSALLKQLCAHPPHAQAWQS